MNSIMKNEIFKKDLYRWYGEKGESFKDRIFRPLEIKYLYAFRKVQSSRAFLTRFWYMFKLWRIYLKSHIQISPKTKIGEGFYIGHFGRIIVNSRATLGKNINIATGVTIGQESRGKRKGVPTIGDNVWIGTNAVIVGNINIGEDVLIAPLAFVNFDVPSHSIVIGNPGKIISKENATEGYVLNKI